MSFRIDDDKLLKSIKPFGLRLKNIELNALPVYHDRSIKAKTRTNDD